MVLAHVGGSLLTLLVPGESTRPTVILKLLDELLLAPSDLSGEISEGAELSEVLESDDLQSIWDNKSLLGVIGGGNSLKDLELA